MCKVIPFVIIGLIILAIVGPLLWAVVKHWILLSTELQSNDGVSMKFKKPRVKIEPLDEEHAEKDDLLSNPLGD